MDEAEEGVKGFVAARVFEPFATACKSNVGLGLSVSHALVASLGGSLRAESREGVGTTFIAHLPQAAEPPQQLPEDRPATGT